MYRKVLIWTFEDLVSNRFRRIFESFRDYMETGLPHLGLQPLDPLSVPQIQFTFFEAVVELKDAILNGFKGNTVKYSEVDPDERLSTSSEFYFLTIF